MPGTRVFVLLVFVMDRSVTGWNWRETVEELLAGLGSATPLGKPTVAVFVNVPVAALAV